MKYTLLLAFALSASSLFAGYENDKTLQTPAQMQAKQLKSLENQVKVLESELADSKEQVLKKDATMLISVVGQGVAPMNTNSPAQAYALAKRAAVSDAYRLIAEKVKGVKIDGHDIVKNMMVKRSTVRTSVNGMVRNANVVETTFKEGLCEVEMEITIAHSQFVQ